MLMITLYTLCNLLRLGEGYLYRNMFGRMSQQEYWRKKFTQTMEMDAVPPQSIEIQEYVNTSKALIGVPEANDAVYVLALTLALKDKDQALNLALKDKDLALKDKELEFERVLMNKEVGYLKAALESEREVGELKGIIQVRTAEVLMSRAACTSRGIFEYFLKSAASELSIKGTFNAKVTCEKIGKT